MVKILTDVNFIMAKNTFIYLLTSAGCRLHRNEKERKKENVINNTHSKIKKAWEINMYHGMKPFIVLICDRQIHSFNVFQNRCS